MNAFRPSLGNISPTRTRPSRLTMRFARCRPCRSLTAPREFRAEPASRHHPFYRGARRMAHPPKGTRGILAPPRRPDPVRGHCPTSPHGPPRMPPGGRGERSAGLAHPQDVGMTRCRRASGMIPGSEVVGPFGCPRRLAAPVQSLPARGHAAEDGRDMRAHGIRMLARVTLASFALSTLACPPPVSAWCIYRAEYEAIRRANLDGTNKQIITGALAPPGPVMPLCPRR